MLLGCGGLHTHGGTYLLKKIIMDIKDKIIKKQDELIDLILFDPANDVRIPLDIKVKLALNEIKLLKEKI